MWGSASRRAVTAIAAGLMVALPAVALPAGAAASPAGGRFVDDDGNVHEGSIEAIAAAGITMGRNPPVNDRFCPGEAVSRAQ